MEQIEADYEAGEFIKEKLIPNSVGWFTGDALEYESDESEPEDSEDDGEDDDDDEDDEVAPPLVAGAPAADPECKQQ